MTENILTLSSQQRDIHLLYLWCLNSQVGFTNDQPVSSSSVEELRKEVLSDEYYSSSLITIIITIQVQEMKSLMTQMNDRLKNMHRMMWKHSAIGIHVTVKADVLKMHIHLQNTCFTGGGCH